ncbi:MAG: ABC transporter ATP-binding protein [Oscillospiraceae bacterium]|nr:ABC transporter ATP-binding protein [Oscillospiraceae bacterium]
MKQTILEAKGLCKRFAHNGGQNHVLSNLDLELYAGDFTVIMGASGSGKSTLLYALSGMDRATSGEVLFDGKELVSLPEKELAALRRSDFGFVFQQMHLISNLSLLENVVVPGYLAKKKSPEAVRERAEALLRQMGLNEAITRLPNQASGGEQQRCSIARAVINEPKLLFADEPTGSLNRRASTEVLNLLTELNRAGQSILMVTHDPRSALRASRLLYLEDGKILGDLSLPPYAPEQEEHRQTQVNAWLSSMQW